VVTQHNDKGGKSGVRDTEAVQEVGDKRRVSGVVDHVIGRLALNEGSSLGGVDLCKILE